MFGFTYFIGDPEKRSKIKSFFRVVWKSIVYALALIGLGNILFFVWRVTAI